jgi:two-component system sensor histidine kinase DesK
MLAAAAAFPAFTRPPVGAFPVSLLAAMVLCGALTVALTPLLGVAALVAVVLVSAAAASGLSAGTGASWHALAGAFLVYAVFIAGFVVTCRGSAWTLRIMWELDRSRAVQARLSVAEERLRFARDLHDVLGRNLSLIAVTSELAAQLAHRGDEEAAAGHMIEVRRVAHESLREMRAVVSGYRTADLDAELAGAQDVLRSAGVRCRIIGDAAGLPADVQAALGWVVREGTTNVIRHSDATACTIDLRVADSPGTGHTVTLRMDNDRVRSLDAGAGGTGLRGLSERLAGLGGSITTQHPRSGHFRLEASLPASGTAADPPAPGQPGPAVTTEKPVP